MYFFFFFFNKISIKIIVNTYVFTKLHVNSNHCSCVYMQWQQKLSWTHLMPVQPVFVMRVRLNVDECELLQNHGDQV